MQPNNTPLRPVAAQTAPQKTPSRNSRIVLGITGIVLPLLIVFVFGMMFSTVRVIRAPENKREITQAYVVENRSDPGRRRAPGSRNIVVTFTDNEGKTVESRIILPPRHKDLPEYVELLPGDTLTIAYIAGNPTSTAYPAAVRGGGEYTATVLSSMGGPTVLPIILISLLGGILMIAAGLLLLKTAGSMDYRAKLQSGKTWLIAIGIACLLTFATFWLSFFAF